MGLLLPDYIEREREVEQQLGKSIAWVERYNASLRAIDPHLELIRAKESATEPGLIPGFWHVKRQNANGVSFMPILGDDGGYAEPGEYHLNELRKRDLWNPTVMHELRTRAARRERELERERARFKEQRVDELAINIKALANPSIYLGAKTARAAGKRDA